MNRYLNDQGKVAVIYSPGYGAGWSTWNTQVGDELVFDPGLVKLILDENYELAIIYAKNKWPGCYTGGLEQAKIEWLSPNTSFEITHYDGYELIGLANRKWLRT